MSASSCGFIRILKEAGQSSFQALGPAKWAVKPARIGHAGTLDPDATGLLIVAIGPATRLISYAEAWDKTYTFRLRLGWCTDTMDTSGATLATALVPEGWQSQLRTHFAQFLGEITQIPPQYSAIKIDGQRAYDLARKGREVEMPSRQVQIHTLEWIADGADELGPWMDLRCRCSKGTYVRSLGSDLAKSIGTLGVVEKIHREAIGEIGLEGAVTSAHIREHGLPPLESLDQFVPFPKVTVPEHAIERTLNGNAYRVEHEVQGMAYLVDSTGEILCLAEGENKAWQPRVKVRL